MEQENLHRRLIATARSLKKQKQRLKATQDTLNHRWNKVLDTEEKYGGNHHTKSYPKRKLLHEFDDKAIEPIQPETTDQPDRSPRGRDKMANDAAHKLAHDLRELLDKKSGMARSIYGSRKHASAHDQSYRNDHIDRKPARIQN